MDGVLQKSFDIKIWANLEFFFNELGVLFLTLSPAAGFSNGSLINSLSRH